MKIPTVLNITHGFAGNISKIVICHVSQFKQQFIELGHQGLNSAARLPDSESVVS